MQPQSIPRIYKRAKILATIGPATHSYDAVKSLIQSGVNGFRLNFSHGSNEERLQQIAWIRRASAELDKPVAILQDLQGPKIRLGDFDVPKIEVRAGDELRLTYGAQCDGKTVIPVQYDLSKKMRQGERLYIFDGKVRTTVVGVEPGTVMIRVENNGILMKRKGINVPDTDFGGDVLTEKDMRDIAFGAELDIDYVSMSFVQTAADIENLKAALARHGSDARVIAKIETQAAIDPENLEAITKAAHGVMVARGDLAVETSPEIVPIVQRNILALCQKHGKISIVATQMLISMVDSPEPTRAEVSDIANAVITGADCLMLSDETANGEYPLEAVATMKRVILYTQENAPVRPLLYDADNDTLQDAISSAVTTLAQQIHARAIICETKTGQTARSIASHRPSMPIISVTSVPRVAQQLALLYANKSFLKDDGERAGLDIAKELRANNFFDAGDHVVLVSGKQPGVPNGTDTIRVRTL